MKVTVLESAIGPLKHQQILATYVVNDSLAIDGGSLGFATPLDVQRKIQHLFLSHSHLDHVASVPIFIDNTYTPGPECPSVYGSAATLKTLQTDVFNDRIWPDMIRLSAEESPFLKLCELSDEVPVVAGELTVTPISVKHVIPTFGFLVTDGQATVAFVSDTAQTDRIWDVINAQTNLKAVFLECSFPNSMKWLADKAMHLTPELFVAELKKLKHDVPIIAIHIKPAFEPQIVKELKALGLNQLQIAQPGKTYAFS